MNRFDPFLSRRNLIKGLGTLGILSAVETDTLLAASTPIAPVRVLFVALQHGWGISGSSNQAMTGTESEFQFPAGLAPFNRIKDKAVVIDGLATLAHGGNAHDLSYADILTAGVPIRSESSSFDSHMPLSVTPSLDYLLEQQSGKASFRFSAGYYSWGARYHPLSIDNRATVLPYHTSPYSAYNAFFKGISAPTALKPGDLDVEPRLLKNLFQFIRTPAQRDLFTLTGDEKSKLNRYLDAVADAEARHRPVVSSGGNQTLATIPTAAQAGLPALATYLDMIKVGFANNMTTSAVLGIGDIHNIDKFHETHAHSDSPTYWQTRTDFAGYIARFVDELDAIVDFDGNSLLHNTIILLTGEVGDGTHDILCKGQIMFGGGGGRLRTGRYLKQALVPASAQGALRREDINRVLQPQIQYISSSLKVGTRSNADLLREIGNMAGLNLTQFGLPSQNKGSVVT
jgi:hypothetical protein